MTLVAIHQPNFFPWLGYFDKIRRADVFIFLDAVDYPRAGSGGMGSWTNRVKIAVNGEPHWLTAPVRRMPLGEPISAARIDDSKPWRKKALRTLDIAYRRAPHHDKTMAFIAPLLMRDDDALGAYNMANIEAIAMHMGLETRFVRQSTLGVETSSTQRLVDLILAVGGTAYLSGGGAGGYQKPELFDDAGVDLVMQDFKPHPYGDGDTYIAGLSVIDWLMNADSKGQAAC